MWSWTSVQSFDSDANETQEKKHHVSPSSACNDLTTRSTIFHMFLRAPVPGVLQLRERFFLSLRSTILTLWVIKKISSLNVKYLGGKSLPKSDLAHNCCGPHACLLNTQDCQDCIIQNINKEQRLGKKCEELLDRLGETARGGTTWSTLDRTAAWDSAEN